jgi:DNA ligase-1
MAWRRPIAELFAWLEGQGGKPVNARRRPVPPGDALPPPSTRPISRSSTRRSFAPNGNGMASVSRPRAPARSAVTRRLYSRTGEDISGAFPDLLEALPSMAALDGELLVADRGRASAPAPFPTLQQRLNRKTVSPKLLRDYPAHLRAYDLLQPWRRGSAPPALL